MTATIPVALGDIFESTWGYDQTNVDYYEITAISPKGRVKIRAIKKRRLSDPYEHHVKVSPIRGVYCGEESGYKKVDYDTMDGEPWVRITSFSGAWRVHTHGAEGANALDIVATETGVGYGH
jgi:hypothetical protein